jgi:hypothetical protein
MDEMSMVRWLLDEPPPPPHVVAEGRERLFGSPDPGVRTIPTASGVSRTRRSRLAFWSTLGLTGAAAAAALAVATLVPGAGTTPEAGDPATPEGSARNVLLVAAARAESTPTNGTYWHVRRMSRTTGPQKLGHGEDRYTLQLRSITEEWTKRNGQAWWGRREWVRPKTAEDEAAWRRDGSPSKWCMGKTDTEPPEPICLHTAPGTASLMKDYHAFEVVEGRELTFTQLQRLPEDADALRAWIVDAVKDDLDKPVPADVLDFNVTDVLANLLVDVPVPPRVRAAAYRALADMPNVKSTGPTRDELGRAGVGIVIDDGRRAHVVGPGVSSFKAGKLTRKLIIDPDASYVLASQTSIGKSSDSFSGTLILEVGWTNEKPHKPAMP